MNDNERRLARERMKLTTHDKSIEDMGTVRFIVTCNRNAPEVLRKAKEVLLLANEHALELGPESEQWLSVLPQWFLDACKPRKSHAEEIEEAEQRAKLPYEQKIEYAKTARWSALDWAYWILPEERIWIWWDAICTDYNTIVVAVEVTDWPFPSGALDWLFRACGAITVEPEV